MVTDQWIFLTDTVPPLKLHIREWRNPAADANAAVEASAKPPFVLVHGLASNARTWDEVAPILAAHGHRVIAVDQRGHGLSDKPEGAYDFAAVTADLHALLEALDLDKPIIAGQSWGGNVALAFGARYPDRMRGLSFVDGGYLDLQLRADNSWEAVERDLKPPSLAGVPAVDLVARMRTFHPDWSEVGIAGTMANFEVLEDGSVRTWLTLPRHMQIVRALWEQRPAELFPLVQAPVYIAAAEDHKNPDWMAIKGRQVAAAEAGLARSRVEWYPTTDHDIHIHRPVQLAAAFLAELEAGVWSWEEPAD